MPRNRRKGLSDAQHIAIGLIVAGKTDDYVAKKVDVTSQTIWRWRDPRYHPAFAEELNRYRQRAWEGTEDQFCRLVPKAFEALDRALTEGDTDQQLAAASIIMRSAGPILKARIAPERANPNGPADGTETHELRVTVVTPAWGQAIASTNLVPQGASGAQADDLATRNGNGHALRIVDVPAESADGSSNGEGKK